MVGGRELRCRVLPLKMPPERLLNAEKKANAENREKVVENGGRTVLNVLRLPVKSLPTG